MPAVPQIAALQRTPTLTPRSTPGRAVPSPGHAVQPPTPQQLSATPVSRATAAAVSNPRCVIAVVPVTRLNQVLVVALGFFFSLLDRACFCVIFFRFMGACCV